MSPPPTDAPPNHGQLAQELFGKISRSLSSIYTNNLTEDFCGKYDISPTWELARLRRAAEQRTLAAEQRTLADQTTNDDTTLKQVEERIRDVEIRFFVKDQFNSATSEEHQYLFEHISKEFQAGEHYGDDDWDYCNEHSLQEFLKLGVSGVRRLRRKEIRKKRIKSSARIIWAIVKSLLQVAIVLGIYGQLQDSYQVIIVSILLTIYSTVALQLSFSAVRFSVGAIKADVQFRELREALGKPLDLASKALIEKSATDLKRLDGVIRIYQFTLGIVDLIALWKLVRALDWF